MSEKITPSLLDIKKYRNWQRRAQLKSQVEIIMGEHATGTVDRTILAPTDITYRLVQQSHLGCLLALPGESLIEGRRGHNLQPTGEGMLTMAGALTVKPIPDRALLRGCFDYSDPDEIEDDPNAARWSCSAGVVFEYCFVEGLEGYQEVGVAILSNGRAGVYCMRAGFTPEGSTFYDSSAGFSVLAREFDAFNKNLATLSAVAGEPIVQ